MAVVVYENDSRLNWINAGWSSGVNYNVHDALLRNGTSYRCILAHTAAADNEPGVGASWTTYWTAVATKGTTQHSLVFSRSGAMIVGAGNMRGPVRATGTIVAVIAMVNTAPTGSSAIFDVHKNGTTIFTTQANRPTIAAGAFSSGVVTNMDVTAISAGDYITVDIDQIGSTIAGSDLSVLVVIQES